jgi:hypothetical protein
MEAITIDRHDVGVRVVYLRDVKRGDYFRKQGQTKVYVRNDYDRMSKRYECVAFDDINNFRYMTPLTLVEINFDF